MRQYTYLKKEKEKRYLYLKHKNKCEKMNVKSISERIKTKYMRENKNLSVKNYILGVIYISIERGKKKKNLFLCGTTRLKFAVLKNKSG